MSPLRRFAALASASLFLSLSAAACGPSPAGDASEQAGDDEAAFSSDVVTKTDAAIKREIAAAAEGALFTSESDYPFKVVSASLPDDTKSITQATVREKLAWVIDHDPDTDKPLASLVGDSSTFAEWRSLTADCVEDVSPLPEDCAKINRLNAALEKNLRGIKVYYFGRSGTRGHVDGIAVSIVIVGLTPKRNLVGVRTIAIWT
jgi:hypothetical protein